MKCELFTRHWFISAMLVLFSGFWALVDAQVTLEWLEEYNGPGNGNDVAHEAALDPAGNIIITGMGYGSTGSDDYITLKYDADGGLLWVATYNGPQNGMDAAEAVAVDVFGNVYVTGYSDAGTSGDDYVTVMYDSAGAELWVSRYDGPAGADDVAHAIALDAVGNVYVTGMSGGTGTDLDYATVKYDFEGNQQWVSRYNGPGNGVDNASSIVVGGDGNVFVTGLSDVDLSPEITNYDFATIKYDAAGTELWVRRYNGPGNSGDGASSLSLDGENNVIVAGNSGGGATMKDYATIKYTTDGILLWEARYHGTGNGSDKIYALEIDAQNNIYVTGESDGIGSDKDYVTIKYSDDGLEQWVSRYDGTGNAYDIAYTLGLDDGGNVFVTGYSWGEGGSFDVATVAYDSMGTELWVMRYDAPAGGFDRAYSLQVDEDGDIYISGASDALAGSNVNDNYLTIKYNLTGNALEITLTPLGPTTFSSSGGVLSYNIATANAGASAEIVDIWVDVTLPDGSLFGPVLGPVLDFPMQAGFSTDRDRELGIPGGAPAGTYVLNGYLGDYSPSNPVILVEDHFEFIKAGSGIGSAMEAYLTFRNKYQDDFTTPEMVELKCNYPNPFNPYTTISFALPEAARVMLAVYDVNGRLVETLVNGSRSAGVHDVTFDASSLSSGVYLYRLEASDFNATGKMILMK